MDCIDFSTYQVMRPFGAAKASPRPINPPNVSPPKFTMPKQMPIAGGMKLIPRVSPAFPNPRTNPYTDNPRGLQFFR